jgi:hypothetical protein
VSVLIGGQAATLAAILGLTGLIVWLDVRTSRVMRSMGGRLENIAARLEIIEARFAAVDFKKNGADHAAVEKPSLMRLRS